MKTHTNNFKEQIKLIGKEIDSRITFGDTVLGKDNLNAVTPSYQGAILKSVMKQLDIDSNVAIPIGTILTYEFGLKVNGEYEYINYGNYVVYSIEKQEDTNSYKITCYDKLLYSMLDYVKLPITYPISVRDYINAISTALGLTFANNNDTFANYDKQIQADLYDGLGYTFRDILDELAQVTASTICLNENDELEIRYITETNDTIDEEFLKDVNVNFGEKFGAVNTIVLSRSGDSDSVYYPSVLPTNPYEIKISDNQIMNGNDRTDYLPDIYEKLNGLEFYTNDFVSTGICYYDLCDRYSVKIGNNTYSCVMFNDEVLVTQGLEENIYTELPEQTETDYKHASKDDRMINQVYLIVKKNEAEILAVINTTEQLQKEINPTKDESGLNITIEDASNNPLTYLEIEGKSEQETTEGYNLYDNNFSRGLYGVTASTEIVENGLKITINEVTSTGSSWGFYINLKSYIANLGFVDGEDILIKYKFKSTNTSSFPQYFGDWEAGKEKKFSPSSSQTYTEWTDRYILCKYNASSSGAGFVFYSNLIKAGDVFEIKDFMIAKSSIDIPYEKYTGKTASPNPNYPSEIQSVGYENLLKTTNWNQYTINASGGTIVSDDRMSTDYIEIKPNKEYIFSCDVESYFYGIAYYDSSKTFLSRTYKNGGNSIVGTTPNNAKYIRVFGQYVANQPFTQDKFEEYKLMLNDGNTKEHNYIPYGKFGIEVKTTNGTDTNISLIVLNNPLRSLPSGVKDIAYIKNGKLYVDRYVGSLILNGSESWNVEDLQSNCSIYSFITRNFANLIKPETICMSNYLKYTTNNFSADNIGIYINWQSVIRLKVGSEITTVEELKNWLSSHNTEIIYELATPVTEELGEIEMPSTFKGINNITTTDDLLPIINLTYVRDTVIADYVENHVAELKLTEKEIKESVESVSSSIDGLNTTVNRVEEITTDTSQILNIISTNIDKTSGEVREVTTTTGFTFNADGMTIDDGSGFKAEHRSQGTYYKDGDTITGEYTKDGSKQKDLELFGTYSYGKKNKDDTPMFVAQLYNDENGEECFGHFYNGEG